MNKILLIAASFFLFNNALAQHPNVGCVDKAIKLQAEDLQQNFTKQAMEIYRDAMVSMSNDEAFPVAVQLNKGVLYQLIFIGSKESSKVRLELFDGDDKKIANKDVVPNKTDYTSNCIVYSFIPGKTDLYLVMLSQRSKSKTMCGSFTIMEKGAKKATTITDTTKTNNSNTPVKNSSNPIKNPRYVPTKK
jgi:hypothetical protein